MTCTEKMTVDMTLTCGQPSVWGVVYQDSADKTVVRYPCAQHAHRALCHANKYRNPNTGMSVVHLETLRRE